jgi:glutathione peroxidase
MTAQNLHSYTIEGIDGRTLDFSKFKGKKILIVNVASECGYTSQYSQLQELYEQYEDKLVVIGVPCNQFGGQEPGSNEKIASFCSSKYAITFPMTSKQNVKGSDAHPVYIWLTSKSKNGVLDAEIKWNFNKFLIDENGNMLAHFGSRVKPFDDEIINYFKK